MSETKANISHKELLTFSNLTNLEWEFADLMVDNEESEDFEVTVTEYKKLNDLLDPELFVRYDSENDSYEYSYPKNTVTDNPHLTDEEKEQGLAEIKL